MSNKTGPVFPFRLENAAGLYIMHPAKGPSRKATSEEIAMWNYIHRKVKK